MPGLLNAKQRLLGEKADQTAAPQAASPQAASSRAASPQAANDDEQAFYERFIKNGLSLIHNEGGMRAIMELVGGGNPVEGLANALVSVLTRLTDTASAQGIEINQDVILQGGSELFLEMADLAEEAGIHDFSKDELEAALAFGLQMFTMMPQKQQAGGQPGMAAGGPAAAGQVAPDQVARPPATTPARGGLLQAPGPPGSL